MTADGVARNRAILTEARREREKKESVAFITFRVISFPRVVQYNNGEERRQQKKKIML